MDSAETSQKETEEDDMPEMPEETEKDISSETTHGSLSTGSHEILDDTSVDLSSTSQSHFMEEVPPAKFKLPEDALSLKERQIKAENFEWGIPPVLPLADIIIEAVADIESSDLEKILRSATEKQKARILELLPLHFPLEVVLPILDDGIYWKRLCLRSWPAWDVWRYSDSWKCMFIHRSVQELIENFIPDKDNIEELVRNIEVFSKYVTSLTIHRLIKHAPEKIDIDVFSEYFEQQLDDIITSQKNPIYLDFEKVFGCLQNLKNLTIALSPSCICLENFHFNSIDFNSLFRGMKKLNKLENIRLSNENFSNEQLSKVLQLFCSHETLTELNFSFNFVDDTLCYSIARLLLCNASLENLILKYNKITDKGAKIIATALFSDTKLKKLDLSLNMIGNDGATTIAKVLFRNDSLIDLDLSKNKITDEGGTAFAELVKKSKTLRSLKLQENFLGEKAGKELADAIKENGFLIELEVRFCGFKTEDEGRIHRAILRNRSKVPYTGVGKKTNDTHGSECLF